MWQLTEFKNTGSLPSIEYGITSDSVEREIKFDCLLNKPTIKSFAIQYTEQGWCCVFVGINLEKPNADEVVQALSTMAEDSRLTFHYYHALNNTLQFKLYTAAKDVAPYLSKIMQTINQFQTLDMYQTPLSNEPRSVIAKVTQFCSPANSLKDRCIEFIKIWYASSAVLSALPTDLKKEIGMTDSVSSNNNNNNNNNTTEEVHTIPSYSPQ